MSKTRTFSRYFLVYQDSKQEAWLEAQARRGLHLTRPGLFRYSFAEGEPREQKYRMDFQMLRGAARDEYLGLFRDAGWEFLGQVANHYYFRARPDAFTPEIFTDVESRKQRIRRQMQMMAVVLGLLVFETMMGVTQALKRSSEGSPGASMTVPVLTIILAGVFTALAIWCVWQMEQAYKRLGS